MYACVQIVQVLYQIKIAASQGVVTSAYAYKHLQPGSQNGHRVTKHFSYRSRSQVYDSHESRSLAKWVGLEVVVKIMQAVTGHRRIF